MTTATDVIEKFYTAFQNADAETMASCYHDEVVFSDPVFIGLEGEEARSMWRMLLERGKDLAVEFSGVEGNGDRGKAHWEARYTFSATGRHVHNRIDAEFRLRDGKIVHHRDHFDLWAWTRMALGLPGVLLGWSPLIQGKVRRTARASLQAYMKGA